MAANIRRRFLTALQAKRLHAQLIAPSLPSQPTMLDSAVDSPMNHKHYHGQTDVFQLAGTLAEKVLLNHPYQDGNKRTALYAADVFLKMNGYQLGGGTAATAATDDADDDDDDGAHFDERLANAHVLVATRQWTSDDLARFYASVARPLDEASREVQSRAGRDAVEC
ncbi:hypothetical protein E4U41_005325 [Claviceps citrina]|nr:hypothetical protein E4U41_005325 [Claviceps citrina]